MAGNNHRASCTCGWCTGGGNRSRSYGWGNSSLKSKNDSNPWEQREFKVTIYKNSIETLIEFPGPNNFRINEKKLISDTTPIICKYCGATIYFYQNEYGSKVFFNQLGKPWERHECKEYLIYITSIK